MGITVQWEVRREHKKANSRVTTPSIRTYNKQFGSTEKEREKALKFLSEKRNKGYHARIVGESV